MLSVQEKYDFLLSKLKVAEIDLYECDAVLYMPRMYFQFPKDLEHPNIKDKYVEYAMEASKFDAEEALKKITQ